MAGTLLISILLLVLGIVLWNAGAAKERRERKANNMPRQRLETEYQALRGSLIEFRVEIGGLPALPERPIDYEGWFQDVKKRIEMRSEKRTLIEHVEMAKRFNELHSQWLQLAHTNYELSRVNARASVEDAKIKLELKEIEV